MKRVLIIDDKDSSETHSSTELISTLSTDQRSLVHLETTVKSLWNLNENRDQILSLDFDPSKYNYIFLHQSINDPILNNPDLLINRLPKSCLLILFSGGRSESLTCSSDNGYNHSWTEIGKHYEIRRSIYFNNLPKFLDSYLELGEFMVQALYDSNFNPSKERALVLVNEIMVLLEDSVQNAINSKEFDELLSFCGYSANGEKEKIKANYLTFDDGEFIEAIEDLSANL